MSVKMINLFSMKHRHSHVAANLDTVLDVYAHGFWEKYCIAVLANKHKCQIVCFIMFMCIFVKQDSHCLVCCFKIFILIIFNFFFYLVYLTSGLQICLLKTHLSCLPHVLWKDTLEFSGSIQCKFLFWCNFLSRISFYPYHLPLIFQVMVLTVHIYFFSNFV